MSVASISILTQYYPPETGAPQNRLHSLARFMVSKGFDVRVYTAMPNYPTNRVKEGYRGKWVYDEILDDVNVFRSWIFVPQSRGIVARLLNYFSFAITSFFRLFFATRADFLLCESPPLFLGLTAVTIARLKGSKLIFNVSDLWPESAEKLGLVTNKTALRLSYALEGWIYKNSWLISGQTHGIVENIQARFPGQRVVWLPNGIDLDFQNNVSTTDWRMRWGVQYDEFVVLYAGIIGHAQGLEVILEAATRMMPEPVRFVLAGDGPEKERLRSRARELNLNNIYFQDNIPKQEMAGMIRACSVFVVPLRKLDLFRGAIPSKIFEPLALAIPIALGVEGEARELFIGQGHAGLAFEPENAEDLAGKLRWLRQNPDKAARLGENGKQYVVSHFNRLKIYQTFVDQLAIVE
jgi:glycosyltransferase involved in cell wall biosynthesis